MNSASFVFYESVYKQLQTLEKRLGTEVALEYINAVIEFGLYGVVPEEESDVWLYGFEQTITSIDRAKDRHEKAIENGKKGGRPTLTLNQEEVMNKYNELKTWKATAAYFKVDEDTLRKFRKQWEEKAEKPKNLNNNVNVNINDNETTSSACAIAQPSGGSCAAGRTKTASDFTF